MKRLLSMAVLVGLSTPIGEANARLPPRRSLSD